MSKDFYKTYIFPNRIIIKICKAYSNSQEDIILLTIGHFLILNDYDIH